MQNIVHHESFPLRVFSLCLKNLDTVYVTQLYNGTLSWFKSKRKNVS